MHEANLRMLNQHRQRMASLERRILFAVVAIGVLYTVAGKLFALFGNAT